MAKKIGNTSDTAVVKGETILPYLYNKANRSMYNKANRYMYNLTSSSFKLTFFT